MLRPDISELSNSCVSANLKLMFRCVSVSQLKEDLAGQEVDDEDEEQQEETPAFQALTLEEQRVYVTH